MPLLQLSISFSVEEEDRPDLSALCSEIERRLRNLPEIDEAFVDVGGSLRNYSLVVEISGQTADAGAAQVEMLEAVRRMVPRLAREPRVGGVWPLDEEEGDGDDD